MGKVDFTCDQVEPILQKFWNLSLRERVTECFSINGKIFLVTTIAGDQYILKVYLIQNIISIFQGIELIL